MALAPIASREEAEIIHGALVYFVQDGDTFGTDGAQKTASKDEVPTFEDAQKNGRFLGSVESWKWNRSYKEFEKSGCRRDTQNYRKTKTYALESVAPEFTLRDINKEAYMLEYGLETLPEVGKTAQPFGNSSGVLRGHLYIVVLDSLRTHGEDGELAAVTLRGELSIPEDSENNGDDLKQVTFRFNVLNYPKDGFKNLGLSLPD